MNDDKDREGKIKIIYVHIFVPHTYVKGKKDLDASKRHLSMKGHLRNSKMQNYPITH